MLKNILSILDSQSKKKLIFLILSNILIGILEMISFSSIYVYIKFILFDELIFKEHLLNIFPTFFELKKFDQTIYFSILIFGLFSFKNLFLIILLKIEARVTEIIFFNLSVLTFPFSQIKNSCSSNLPSSKNFNFINTRRENWHYLFYSN